jgi:hypothetical protein
VGIEKIYMLFKIIHKKFVTIENTKNVVNSLFFSSAKTLGIIKDDEEDDENY